MPPNSPTRVGSKSAHLGDTDVRAPGSGFVFWYETLQDEGDTHFYGELVRAMED